MGWRSLCLLWGFLCYLLSSMALQTPDFEKLIAVYPNGAVLRQPAAGNKLSFQLRELQAIETKAAKKRETSTSSHRQDATIASSKTVESIGTELPTDTPLENAVTNDKIPVNEDTHSLTVQYPPPFIDEKNDIDRKNETKPLLAADTKDEKGNVTDAGDSVPDKSEVDPVDDHGKDNDNYSETNTQKSVKKCGGNYCEDPKKLISACLSTPGDRVYKLSLFITYEGDERVLAKVITPEFLKAEPVKVSMSKGKSETIQISIDSNHMMDAEAAQNKTIVVTSVHGNCDVQVPVDYLLQERPHVLPSVDPMIITYLVVFVLAISCAGVWLCYRCRRRKRSGEVKYQHLEMNGIAQIMPEDGVEEANNSWDEVWDDDWEDPESARPSSSAGQSLSSGSTAARRGLKDGWNTSWED